MKINRLLEILILLLNKKNVTAKMLAERFHISTRTIYRDLDVLSSAGIPIYTNRGSNGGISLLDQYSLNKTMLTEPERGNILFALQTLQATKFPEIDLLIEKLGGLFQQQGQTDWIHIDFSPWGSDQKEEEKFLSIKQGILESRVLSFHYIDSHNTTTIREVEPLQLLFKSRTWYLKGWCLKRDDYRTFRISRMKEVVVTDCFYEREKVQKTTQKEEPVCENPPTGIPVLLKFDKSLLFRLYDDYDASCIEEKEDGYLLRTVLPEEWLYSYLFGFGDKVEVIEPIQVREKMREKIFHLFSKYDIQ